MITAAHKAPGHSLIGRQGGHTRLVLIDRDSRGRSAGAAAWTGDDGRDFVNIRYRHGYGLSACPKTIRRRNHDDIGVVGITIGRDLKVRGRNKSQIT